MRRAVTDSVIHRLFSRRWPITMQKQRSTTNKVIEFMGASPVVVDFTPSLIKAETIGKPIEMEPLNLCRLLIKLKPHRHKEIIMKTFFSFPPLSKKSNRTGKETVLTYTIATATQSTARRDGIWVSVKGWVLEKEESNTLQTEKEELPSNREKNINFKDRKQDQVFCNRVEVPGESEPSE